MADVLQLFDCHVPKNFLFSQIDPVKTSNFTGTFTPSILEIMKKILTPISILAAAGTAHAITVSLGDQTIGITTQNDGWSSNSHVQTNVNGLGPGGIVYQYTNTSGDVEIITPLDWNYVIQGNGTPDFATFNVTPFLVRIDQGDEVAGPSAFTILSIGTTRVGGPTGDFNAQGVYNDPFGGSSFTLADGETVAIGVIDSNADGTGPAHNPAGGIIPFDGAGGGDSNHWYNGNSAQNTYPNGTPGGVGVH